MIKVYCDKCGKEIEEYDAYIISIEGPQIIFWDDNNFMRGRKRLHICKNCMVKLADYIYKKEE